jgi:lipopolysaccharide transport system ATP-binding protein
MDVIKVENLSKLYRLGQVGTGSIFHDVNRWWYEVRGKEDPYIRVGEENDRTQKGKGDYVWALKGINFEVAQGEVLGIIGRNGAGKSTLLKILSRTTAPTTGSIKVKGRIASLLEVGTGFHPELSGRDNIFMNGTILGMTRAEIKSKFDEIVEFAGVARYLDTPVKRYSSGMYVRLAFAVAAHLESEILIVDEVLAVGDAEFQKKCLGKMRDVSERQGRTVLFVSHNMQAIKNMSKKVLVIDNGVQEYIGESQMGAKLFLESIMNNNVKVKDILCDNNIDTPEFQLNNIQINQDGSITNAFVNTSPLNLKIDFKIKTKLIGFRIGFDLVSTSKDLVIYRSYHDHDYREIDYVQPGNYTAEVSVPTDVLKEDYYVLNLLVGIHNVKWLSKDEIKIPFFLNNVNKIDSFYHDNREGLLSVSLKWSLY